MVTQEELIAVERISQSFMNARSFDLGLEIKVVFWAVRSGTVIATNYANKDHVRAKQIVWD